MTGLRLPARRIGRRGRWTLGLAAGAAGAAAASRLRAHPAVRAARLPATKPTSWWGVIQETFSDYSADEIPRRGAALAYYTVFSLAPLILIMITIVGLFFGADAARGMVSGQLSGVLGPSSAKALQDMIAGANRPTAGTVAGIIGAITLLSGAAAVVGELQDSLARIWGLSHKTGGLGYMLRSRLLSFAFVLGLGFLLLVSLIAGAAIAAAGKFVSEAIPVPEAALQAVNQAFAVVTIGAVFALMFRYLPPARFPWRVVLVGGFVTSLLFTAGNAVLTLYIGKGGPTSAYGAAGSILAIMLWTYYSAQILYLGAEFTEAYAYRRGVALSRKQSPPSAGEVGGG